MQKRIFFSAFGFFEIDLTLVYTVTRIHSIWHYDWWEPTKLTFHFPDNLCECDVFDHSNSIHIHTGMKTNSPWKTRTTENICEKAFFAKQCDCGSESAYKITTNLTNHHSISTKHFSIFKFDSNNLVDWILYSERCDIIRMFISKIRVNSWPNRMNALWNATLKFTCTLNYNYNSHKSMKL